MKRGSSASIISGLHSSETVDFISSKRMSLSEMIFTSSLVLFINKTFWGKLHRFIALSTIDFRFIILLPLNEPSDVIMTLLSQSFILVANASEENPAKTTECIAPFLHRPIQKMPTLGS